MVANSKFYQAPASPVSRLFTKPIFLNILKPALVGALVGGVSGSPNLGILSASATAGLGLLDPTYARRSELLKLREQQAVMGETAQQRLKAISQELTDLKKAIHPRGRVAVFVDGSNLHFSAVSQSKGRIDYDRLFTCCKQGAFELVTVMFFKGLDKTSAPQRGFLAYLTRLNHPIEIIGKALAQGEDNTLREKGIDTEIVLKMVDLIPQYDTAILITGDRDMLGAVRRVQKAGRRVAVMSFPANTSRALRDAADEFVDIGQLDIFG